MVDFAGNPYLNDPRFQLSDDQMRQYRLGSLGSALTSFGAGIAQSGASGQPWMAGIAPGAAMASQSLGQEQARLAQMQDAAAKWAQMEDYRKAQEAHLAATTEMERRKMAREDEGFNLAKGIINNPTGFNMQPNPVQTSPTGFGATGASGNAIGGIESSGQPNGGYGAVGPRANDKGNRAYGKYQVMDFNIPAWTKESLGQAMTPEQFLANPQAQDATYNDQFGKLVQLAGGDKVKAAQMWFAGPKGANNPNARDVNGMTVARYGQQFAANGGAAPVGLGGAGPTMASLPAFQGPGMGAPEMQPGALPAGASPQVNQPAPFAPPTAMAGAPPGMPMGDGGPPGSPAGAGPQMAQAAPPGMPAPQQPGSFDPGPMPTPDPRIKGLMMYPGTKALGEQMQKDYETQLGLWKYNQTEARQGRNEEMKLRQEADKLKQEGQKMVPFGPGQNYEPATDTVYVTDPIAGNSSYKLHGGTPPAQSDIGTPEPPNPNAPPISGNEDFLKTLPPATANLVKAYAEGRMPIPTAAALRNPSMARLMAAVQQYDPSFDAANYQARKNFLTSSTSGPIFNNVIAPSNKFLNHASSYLDAYDKLGMGGGLTSYVTNPYELGKLKAARSGEYMSAETNLQGVKDEFAKFMGGKGQLTDLARKLESELSITSSPAETYATIGKMKELMQGQLEPVAQQRKELFKQGAPGDFIQPKGQEAIARIDRGPMGAKTEAPKQDAAPTKQPTPLAPPVAGYEKNGYRFRGGDPSKSMNWEKIQ